MEIRTTPISESQLWARAAEQQAGIGVLTMHLNVQVATKNYDVHRTLEFRNTTTEKKTRWRVDGSRGAATCRGDGASLWGYKHVTLNHVSDCITADGIDCYILSG